MIIIPAEGLAFLISAITEYLFSLIFFSIFSLKLINVLLAKSIRIMFYWQNVSIPYPANSLLAKCLNCEVNGVSSKPCGKCASCLAIVTASNLNNTGADITGVLETSAGVRTSDCSDVDKLGGIQTFASPVVITKDLKTINVAFGISEGMTIWENGTTPPVINMGSGPFQAVITAVNY